MKVRKVCVAMAVSVALGEAAVAGRWATQEVYSMDQTVGRANRAEPRNRHEVSPFWFKNMRRKNLRWQSKRGISDPKSRRRIRKPSR